MRMRSKAWWLPCTDQRQIEDSILPRPKRIPIQSRLMSPSWCISVWQILTTFPRPCIYRAGQSYWPDIPLQPRTHQWRTETRWTGDSEDNIKHLLFQTLMCLILNDCCNLYQNLLPQLLHSPWRFHLWPIPNTELSKNLRAMYFIHTSRNILSVPSNFGTKNSTNHSESVRELIRALFHLISRGRERNHSSTEHLLQLMFRRIR